MATKNVIRLRGVSVYQSGEPVLTDVDLDVSAGEFVYFIGRVGSGKTSLMKLLYAELPLYTGTGEAVGFDLTRMRKRDIAALRRQLGVVFQDYRLLTDRNVFLNLHYVMRATGWRNEQQIRMRIEEVLQLTGLMEKHYKMPHELSGGEQQRLVIARALLNKPRLLLADEPTGNLDPAAADGIMELFKRISYDGTAVVMSTHNTTLVEEHPARTILFSNNRIQEL